MKGNKFRSADPSTEWLDMEDERFINWMMPSTYFNTYKAWFRVPQTIPAGEYKFRIYNQMDPALFDGQKLMGFEEIGPLGAKNYFVLFLTAVVFIASLVFSVIFRVMTNRENAIMHTIEKDSQRISRSVTKLQALTLNLINN